MKTKTAMQILQEQTDSFAEQSRLRDDVLDAMHEYASQGVEAVGQYDWQNEFYAEIEKYYPRAEHRPEIKDSVDEFQKVFEKYCLPSSPASPVDGIKVGQPCYVSDTDPLCKSKQRGNYLAYYDGHHWVESLGNATFWEFCIPEPTPLPSPPKA